MFAEAFNKSKLFAALAVIIVGILGRFFMLKFIGIPNFEIITALTLVSAVFLGRIWGIVVPLSIIAITDVVIGNSSVLIFTWSAFAIIGIFGWLFKRHSERSEESLANARNRRQAAGFFASFRMTIVSMTALGTGSSVFFFLYTNFGWWLVSNMYPHTLDGLIQAYIMGLPFFKNNLIGNLIFVPIFSGVVIFLKSGVKNKTWNLKKILAIQKS